MNLVRSTLSPTIRAWVGVLLTALAYFLIARLSLMLAIPPVDASPVWPPAGIAVASIVLLGKRAALGVYIGAISLYLFSWLQGVYGTPGLNNLLLVALLALCPAIQSLVVVHLMAELSVQELPEATEPQILRFMLVCAPAGALVAPSLAHVLFVLFGLPGAGDGYLSWVYWWIGDAIGIMTMTPLVLMLFMRSRNSQERRRKLSVVFPTVVLLSIVILLFFFAQRSDDRESENLFLSQTERLHNVLDSNVQQSADAIYALKMFLENSERVSAEEFENFTGVLIRNKPYIRAIEWIPKVTWDERAAFESNPETPAHIMEWRDGEIAIAARRDVYFPVLFVNPLDSNESVLGFDVSSSVVAQQAQSSALQSLDARATLPIDLVQGGESGFVVYIPAMRGGRFLGFCALVIHYRDFFDYLLGVSGRQQSEVAVTVDVKAESEPVRIYQSHFYDDQSRGVEVGHARSNDIELFGQVWQLTYESPGAYHHQRFVSNSVIVLFAGMLFTALFGGWLLTLSGQALRVSREVDRRTHQLQREVEEREQTQKELSKLSLAIEHSPSMVLITDPQGSIEYANPKYTDISGYSLSELSDKNANQLYEQEYGPQYYSGLVDEIRIQGEWKGELKSHRKNGEEYWTQVSIAPVYDDSLRMSHVVSVHQDITESKQIQDKLSYQATHDQLTGLINRYEFERQLQRLMDLQKVTGQSHAYCFCDLDQFKVINDTSGHAAGDALLKQVSQLLQQNLRRNDVLARLGGDEFGVLMENCTTDEAMQVARKILTELEEFRFVWSGALHTVGTSIGVVMIDDHCDTSTDVLKNADSACYAAKEAGRNRIHLYTTDDEVLAKREGEISWVAEIASALEEDRFELHGQVIRPISDPAMKPSIELLIRLRLNDQLVMPGAFLPAAERYGLSAKIDRWVVSKTFQWLAEHMEMRALIESLAINLSGHSLGDGKLLDYIIDELEAATFEPSLVKFEITETAAIANLAETSKFISRVKAFGCELSLDDFGSGLSSFAYLKNLPVDYLKIDGMFVKDIVDDPIDRAMVKSINDIGHVMNKMTIAEFVENDEILSVLKEIGVDYAQGYGIGRPQPLDQLIGSLAENEDVFVAAPLS